MTLVLYFDLEPIMTYYECEPFINQLVAVCLVIADSKIFKISAIVHDIWHIGPIINILRFEWRSFFADNACKYNLEIHLYIQMIQRFTLPLGHQITSVKKLP